jgi:hypothetical protein
VDEVATDQAADIAAFFAAKVEGKKLRRGFLKRVLLEILDGRALAPLLAPSLVRAIQGEDGPAEFLDIVLRGLVAAELVEIRRNAGGGVNVG